VYPFNPSRTYLLAQCGLGKTFVRGEEHFLYDADGTAHLDFLSQYGVVSFGHNPPELLAALRACSDSQRPAMVQPFLGEATRSLANKLREITPGELGCTVFTNSGTEAVEAAIKLARVRTGRPMILSTVGGFHGKTLGALSATGNPVYQIPFGAPAPGFDTLPFGDLDALADRLNRDGDNIAAFLVEPVQGEGGMVPAPDGYLAGVVDLCRSHGVLSVFDEVQTGLGRTGAMFAASAAEAEPDVMLLGKALGGGLMPIGACICTPNAWDHAFGMLHSSTFAGNQIACTVASAAVDVLLADDQELVRHVAEMGDYLLGRLTELKTRYPGTIKDVRGKGLMAGVEFQRFAGDRSFVMGFASRAGLLSILVSGYLLNSHRIVTAAVFNDAHFLRVEPPFTVGRDEIDQVVKAIEAICHHLEHHEYHELFRHLTDVPPIPRPDGLYVSAASDLGEPRAAPVSDSSNGSFAFLGHYIDEEDYIRTDPSFADYSPEVLARWRHWVAQVGPGILDHVEDIGSATGQSVEGWLLALPMLAEQLMEMRRDEMMALFGQTISLAKRRGARILGLGGFNSVITRGGQRVVGQGIAVTTGNCLSSVMAVDGIAMAVKDQGLKLDDMHVAVIGATGAIGRLSSLLLAGKVGQLTLVGNSLSPDAPQRCKAVADEVQQRAGDLAVRHTCDLTGAVKDADVVLLATSSDQALLHPEHLKPRAIVCDVARPSNVSADLPRERPDVLVFEGGLVQMPKPVSFGRDFQILPEGTTLGCLAETVLLALAGDFSDHSIGQRLDVEEADYIQSLAQTHGFKAASPEACRKT
jgi:acetylornithine/succinyldiaminopimelate/putrescine aminotransferase/predicted amino acid dehydrogenase